MDERTDRQTDRHTDRQTHRNTDTQTQRHTDKHTHTDTQTDGNKIKVVCQWITIKIMVIFPACSHIWLHQNANNHSQFVRSTNHTCKCALCKRAPLKQYTMLVAGDGLRADSVLEDRGYRHDPRPVPGGCLHPGQMEGAGNEWEEARPGELSIHGHETNTRAHVLITCTSRQPIQTRSGSGEHMTCVMTDDF